MEWIDQLPANDPRAIGSRNDMLRLNRLMGHPGFLQRVLRHAHNRGARRLAELGAGRGQLLLRVAGRLAGEGIRFDGVLLDCQPTVEKETLDQFAMMNWKVEAVTEDASVWLERLPPGSVDVLIVVLFLHHLERDRLERLFKLAAQRVKWFVACEPGRSMPAFLAAKSVGLIGCNAVTRHDAPVSVRAGFRGHELSEWWPQRSGWELKEHPLGLFSHVFVAERIHDS